MITVRKLVIVSVVILVALIISGCTEKPAETPKATTPSETTTPATTTAAPVATISESPFLPGTEAHLRTPILVATSESAYDKLQEAFVNGDEYGLRLMMSNEEIFPVDDPNTKVLVLKNSWFKTQIRILTGEYSGSAGWVPMKLVIS